VGPRHPPVLRLPAVRRGRVARTVQLGNQQRKRPRSKAGTPLDHGNVNRQQFKKLLKKTGLPPMRPYDVRHSFATL
jgi:hypothetical protein